MKRFTHLQPDQLSKISALVAAGVSPSAIADGLTRHVSTIRRELGRCKGAYNERDAQANRRAARACCAANAQRFGAEHWARVELGLCQLRSPEQIAGRAWTLGDRYRRGPQIRLPARLGGHRATEPAGQTRSSAQDQRTGRAQGAQRLARSHANSVPIPHHRSGL